MCKGLRVRNELTERGALQTHGTEPYLLIGEWKVSGTWLCAFLRPKGVKLPCMQIILNKPSKPTQMSLHRNTPGCLLLWYTSYLKSPSSSCFLHEILHGISLNIYILSCWAFSLKNQIFDLSWLILYFCSVKFSTIFFNLNYYTENS